MPVEAYRLQAAVDSALEEMRQAGEFDRLNGRWFRPEQLR
jgi:ABC-type amino acid transport substrate-binding protein